MEPYKKEVKRDESGRLLPGSASISPGRPKGQTLKEYIRQRFLEMTNEEKDAFIAKLDPIDLFKMAEGNPHTTTDMTTNGQSIAPVLSVNYIAPSHDPDAQANT